MQTNYKETCEFKKDFKSLSKKYKTLFDDLKNFKRRMCEVDMRANKNFTILFENDRFKIIKARLFCRSLKGNSLRIIYAIFENNQVELISIEFVELYFKGDKSREDKKRINDYLKSF